jgi:RNase H domain-containing protein
MARDDFGEIAASRMSKDMHATSRVEITVPSKGGSAAGDLAVLIARLCDQPIAWDSRTARPAPLHLGYSADRDHPDYGDHDPGGEAEDDELELDDE